MTALHLMLQPPNPHHHPSEWKESIFGCGAWRNKTTERCRKDLGEPSLWSWIMSNSCLKENFANECNCPCGLCLADAHHRTSRSHPLGMPHLGCPSDSPNGPQRWHWLYSPPHCKACSCGQGENVLPWKWKVDITFDFSWTQDLVFTAEWLGLGYVMHEVSEAEFVSNQMLIKLQRIVKGNYLFLIRACRKQSNCIKNANQGILLSGNAFLLSPMFC